MDDALAGVAANALAFEHASGRLRLGTGHLGWASSGDSVGAGGLGAGREYAGARPGAAELVLLRLVLLDRSAVQRADVARVVRVIRVVRVDVVVREDPESPGVHGATHAVDIHDEVAGTEADTVHLGNPHVAEEGDLAHQLTAAAAVHVASEPGSRALDLAVDDDDPPGRTCPGVLLDGRGRACCAGSGHISLLSVESVLLAHSITILYQNCR